MQSKSNRKKPESTTPAEVLSAWLDKRNVKPDSQIASDDRRYFTQEDWNKIFAYLAMVEFKYNDPDGYLRLLERWNEYYEQVHTSPEYLIMQDMKNELNSKDQQKMKKLHAEIKRIIREGDYTKIPKPSSYDPVLLTGCTAVRDYFQIRDRLKKAVSFTGNDDEAFEKAQEIFKS